MDWQIPALALITLAASIVNGALGYGFSSITVPLALLFLRNRTLNPVIVLIEVPLNAYVLWGSRQALPRVWRRMVPVLIGLVPGTMLGTLLLARVSPDWLKLITYAVLLPLILVQAAGHRRPLRSEGAAGLVFGGGVGMLYAVTTISGPPLAVALNNQGFTKHEFRAALGLARLAESSLTATAYASMGLLVPDTLTLLPAILPSLLIGVPLGALLIQHLRSETFRRVCMSFDAWIVSFGAARLLRELQLVDRTSAFLIVALVIAFDAWLLYRYFSRALPQPQAQPEAQPRPEPAPQAQPTSSSPSAA